MNLEAVRKTCTEMLQQRGYSIVKNDDVSTSSILGKMQGMEDIVIFFNETSKLDVERLKEYISMMTELGIHHSIIIYKDAVTPVAKKVVEELPKSAEGKNNYIIELFEFKSLRYNITNHRLVSKHTALDRKECIHFKETYGTKIPILLRMDPIVRFYNFQRGDIIRIDRLDGVVSFRIVK